MNETTTEITTLITETTTETTVYTPAFEKPFEEYTLTETFLGILVVLALICIIYTFTKKRGV